LLHVLLMMKIFLIKISLTMKWLFKQTRFLFFSFFLNTSLTQNISAQSATDSMPSLPTGVMTHADQMPYFKGCDNFKDGSVEKRNCSNQNLILFIAQNLIAPTNSDAVGTAYVSFVVDEQGKVKNASILRGVDKPQDSAALAVVQKLPDWQPAVHQGQPIAVKMNLPIRFTEKDPFDNGFQIRWGNLKGAKASKSDIMKSLSAPITVRDELGNIVDITELMFERDREGKISEAQSKGLITDDMEKIVKKLKTGDTFTMTATVQKKGNFYYVERSFNLVE
jgi:TonB family protein